jgi:hypothetical protein
MSCKNVFFRSIGSGGLGVGLDLGDKEYTEILDRYIYWKMPLGRPSRWGRSTWISGKFKGTKVDEICSELCPVAGLHISNVVFFSILLPESYLYL